MIKKRRPRERLYNIWTRMRSTCFNKNNASYGRYGGRGITIEFNDFATFKEWATANGYSASLTIDREDNDGNYSADNCRWVDRNIQAQNMSTNVLDVERVRHIRRLRENGQTLAQIAAIVGVSKSSVAHVVAGRTWQNVD